MSTPDFLAQDDSNYTPVRFYTAQDPYFYTIDNRPLQDLEENLKASRSGGSDAARRAVALLGLNIGAAYADTVATRDRASAVTGLQVVKTGNNSVRVSPGAFYDFRAISDSNSDPIMKQALLTKSIDFNIPTPTTGGTSLVYTIEGEVVEMTQVNAASSQLPYVDGANPYLPSTYLHGELRLSIINGSSATTGTQVPAPTTDGKFPLYNITLTQGISGYTVEVHQNAPRGKSIRRTVTPVPSNGTAASSIYLNDIPVINLPKSSISSVTLPSVMSEETLNPYIPLKLKIVFSPTATGGYVAFRIAYKGFSNGESAGVANNYTVIDPAFVVAVANGVQTYTTAIQIPTNQFAGFVNNKWVVNREYMKIQLERLGTDVSDTNSGDINIMSVSLVQV